MTYPTDFSREISPASGPSQEGKKGGTMSDLLRG